MSKKILSISVLMVLLSACGKIETRDLEMLDQMPNQENSSNIGTNPPSPPVAIAPPDGNTLPQPIAFKSEPLAWESRNYPDRKNWSQGLTEIVKIHFKVLDTAKDIADFCPRYRKLSEPQRINTWANLIASMAYYESGWDPKQYSVDVGKPGQIDTYSVGLLQMSVIDQVSYKLPFGFKFTDLQTPIPNLRLGLAILSRQIEKRGVIKIPKGSPGLYWAVLHPGGRFDKSAQIAKMTSRLSFCN